MKLGTSKYYIIVNRGTGTLKHNLDGHWRVVDITSAEGSLVNTLQKSWKSKFLTESRKWENLESTLDTLGITRKKGFPAGYIFSSGVAAEPVSVLPVPTVEEPVQPTPVCTIDVEKLASNIMNFFSEFSFEPNFRFVNTIAYQAKKGLKAVRDYVYNYFRLTDSPYADSVKEKMKSVEFKDVIFSDLAEAIPSKQINRRFKLYYGSQGTGKTTEALKETDGLCMVCHSAMLPQDLMEDFKFVDGNPDFRPSALQKAIRKGYKIVLDEINLLPFESLRFLQSILDGKREFVYKGETVKIQDGFGIIGTMNLVVNGSVFSLPDPLVDRASDLKEYKLTASALSKALI